MPLLQSNAQCGGMRRNSLETAGIQCRGASIECDHISHSTDWAASPITPLPLDVDTRVGPPLIAPTPLGNKEDSILKYRAPIVERWHRSDNASYPLISFSWRDNIAASITKVADPYLKGVDLDFSVAIAWTVAQLCDRLNRSSGEVRISPMRIRGLNLDKRDAAVNGLREIHRLTPFLTHRVIDYHTRGVIPVYKGTPHPIPRVRGFPYRENRVWVLLLCFVKMCACGESWFVVHVPSPTLDIFRAHAQR